ncbi:hypothetical protein [Algoriphagus sp. A40]|uniref:hypothetical protein n=1 Tax=Algoriphagus sp. A40 TaxID=1945863 RepID=UPI000985068C|nr:hypothetical protein [Algoriphagus sp. A40]OOG78417.1 hypothetical protein B0E43_01780 [Algoriphagus sp. A40]
MNKIKEPCMLIPLDLRLNDFQKGLFCLWFFLLIPSVVLIARQSELPKETVQFNTPKTLYLTGEKIWFEAEVKSAQEASPSKVLYAELVDRFSNSVAYTKVPLENGSTLNFLLLSNAIPSDQYLLRVYTRISPYLDLELGMAQQFVTVINPKIPPKPISGPIQDLKTSDVTGTLAQISNPAPKPGETFQVSLSAGKTIQAAGISVSNPYLENEQVQLKSGSIYASLEQKAILPELFGHIVESKVVRPDTSLTYFLSLHGKQSALFTDRADADGQILFDAGGLSHWDRLIIQLEDGAEMEGLEIISPVVKTKFLPNFKFPDLVIPSTDLPYLTQLQKAAAVETYYVEKYDSDSLEVVTGFVADYTFLLDDYTRFETVETVIREYVPSVFVRTRDKKKEFRLINEAVKDVFETNPLILIDAMPVFDSDLLTGFNPKFISKLEVLNREFYLNDRTYEGVLSFSSYENNFGLFPLVPSSRFFDYPGLQPKIELERNQFGSPGSGGEFPDFRTILFWGKTGGQSIQASELVGEYVLWVRYLDDSGNLQVSKKEIQIAL